MTDIEDTPGDVIYRARRSKRLTLRAMAKRVGVSHVTCGEWERNVRPVPDRFRAKVAEVLGVSSELLVRTWCSHCGQPLPEPR